MNDIYDLIKTVIISEPGNPDAGYKYDIYRSDDGISDHWHVVPSKRISIKAAEGLHEVWVLLSSKSFSGREDLAFVVSQCKRHYQESA